MKIKDINTKFNIGDNISCVYWDDDIGAWNIITEQCNAIKVLISEDGQIIEYTSDDFGLVCFSEDDCLFATPWDASIEATKRNAKIKKDSSHILSDKDIERSPVDILMYPPKFPNLNEYKNKSISRANSKTYIKAQKKVKK